METHWHKPKITRGGKYALKRAGHLLINLVAAVALVVLSYAPIVSEFPGAGGLAPQTASAKNLEWSDIRPPLTDDRDITQGDGFTALPRFGNVPKPIGCGA